MIFQDFIELFCFRIISSHFLSIFLLFLCVLPLYEVLQVIQKGYFKLFGFFMPSMYMNTVFHLFEV